jgi:endonuclease/exonuclease/phosphatase family metal-dependent hydrolase
LEDTRTGKQLFHFNTHLDHLGKQARKESAALLQKRLTSVCQNKPAVLTGDFNDPPHSEFYRAITTDNFMLDAKISSLLPHYGPEGTWATFDVSTGIGNQIDFVFVSPQVHVFRHATLTDSLNFRFPSDHLPIIADLEILPE